MIGYDHTINIQYNDYCVECKETNSTPLPFDEWLSQLLEKKEN